VTEAGKSTNNVPREDPIPDGAVSVESILCTEELRRRPWRPPDYAKENRAVVALATALVESPHTILQTLADTILEVTRSDSAGVSLLSTDDGGKRFYWPAIAGIWKPHVGGGTPRDFGPCGDTLDRNTTLLFRHLELRYTYFQPVTPPPVETLLVPFYVGGKAVGTIWSLMHDDVRKFDAEDERLMGVLGKVASLAYQTVASIDNLKLQIAEREKAETTLRELANGLETQVRVRTQELDQRNQELERSEFCLAEGQRLAQMGSWGFDPSGRYDYWSEELFRIYGLDPADGPPTLERYLACVHPQDREFMSETIKRMHEQHSGCDLKKRIIRPDGEVRYIRCVGIPVVDNQVLKGFVGTAMDVTEQEELTQQLHRRQAYLAEAQRLSRTGSFGWRVPNGEISWSDETYRIFEVERDTKPTVELVLERTHPEDRAKIQELIAQASQDGRDFEIEHRLFFPDGSVKNVHVVAHALTDGSGNVEFVGAVMDVTAARQARSALETAFKEIEGLKDRLYKENIALREELDKASMFEEIIGVSPQLQSVLSKVSRVAPTSSTVLITGETGTGKELVARAIHRRSDRASHAFVSVNCAAIPRDLVASELFGHEKGAFTGALQRRLGRFELAEGGTIFLDEVGELPAETQIALLRVLQQHEFERVGGTRSIQTNARVIAATNRDLRAAIVAGSFRKDLFYRLNVFPIDVPPLRERKDDIPVLVEYFVDRYARKAGRRLKRVQKQTLELLQAYSWPGNIRELQNVLERSVILSDTENLAVDESWLSPESGQVIRSSQSLAKSSLVQESELIEKALLESRGRVSGPTGAAVKLGIPPSTLESRIRSLKINKYTFKWR
jgi:PAS domain S-box-containing protein